MTDQPALFDASKMAPQTCPVPYCSAIRFPAQDRVVTCHIDRERATSDWVRRPAACLNTVNPVTAPFPEGF